MEVSYPQSIPQKSSTFSDSTKVINILDELLQDFVSGTDNAVRTKLARLKKTRNTIWVIDLRVNEINWLSKRQPSEQQTDEAIQHSGVIAPA